MEQVYGINILTDKVNFLPNNDVLNVNQEKEGV